MDKKRHDDRPERRRNRNRCKRLAVLGFLTLGSNLGCGQNMLRLPAGANGTLLGPAPIPYSARASAIATETAAAGRKPESIGPVAIKPAAGYGSSAEDLFLASYRDANSYGPHRTKSNVAQPSHGESLLPGGLLAASRESGIAPPSLNQGSETRQTALFAQPDGVTHQRDRGPAASPFDKTQIPPPQARSATQGPGDLVSACGVTKIAPPNRAEPSYFPDLESATRSTGIGMPVSPASAPKPEPTTPQPEAPSPTPTTAAELPNPPATPVEVLEPLATEPAAPTTEPAAPATEPAAPAEPPAPTGQPIESAEPAELPSEKMSQPAPSLELPAEPEASAKPSSQPATPDELPPQPPALAEPSSESTAPSDLLADPPALPEMPSVPATPAEPPTAAKLPSEPATPIALPNPNPNQDQNKAEAPALPEEPNQAQPPAEMPGELPPLVAVATEPVVRTKETKVENPGTPFEDASTSPPTPSKPGLPQEQAEDLGVAFEETKIPPPGQASAESPGTEPDQIPLPPLQMDPSVFETSAELPPPLPLATPSPTVAANPECPACEILRKQKDSDHWAKDPAKQSISCPSCEASQARAKAKAKAKAKSGQANHELDSALKDLNLAPPLSSAKVDDQPAP